MNSMEAKRGFLTFCILASLVFGILFVGKKVFDFWFSSSKTATESDVLIAEPSNQTEIKGGNVDKDPKDTNGDGVVNSLDFTIPLPN
jgi:hypothetical protein